MKFEYHIFEELPRLGWAMTLRRGSDTADVYCGAWVEHQDQWFVSGVWDGDFREADFQGAEFFCATGVKICNGQLTVYSPTHERQRLCYVTRNDCVTFSNSIPLLLAAAGVQIDKDCDQYEKILCSILWGTKEYTRAIPVAGGQHVNQVFCGDISVDRELNLTITPKKLHRDFEDFTDYYDSITAVCGRIRANALDSARIRTYEMAATASSGYDSSACAAIIRKVGCDTLMTFRGGFYDEDSPVTIAEQLGYRKIIQRGHHDFRSKEGCKDAEFYVCGDIGVYMQFSAFEEDFAGHIVSIGTSGSYMWDKDGDVNPESRRSGYDFYTANLSFSENALIKGYIILPLPLYASTAVQSIQRISNSPEMEPWTLHTHYDRPICRRILETSGVDGSLFGHKKYGAGFALSKNFTLKQIKPKMSAEGYDAFVKWLAVKGNNRWTAGRSFRMLQYHTANIPVYAAFAASKLHIKTHWGKGCIQYPNPGLPAKLIVWGMEVLTERYGRAMK